MKTNKNTTAKPQKPSGKRKYRSTKETTNSKAKKQRSEEPIKEKSDGNYSIPTVSIRFAARVDTNDQRILISPMKMRKECQSRVSFERYFLIRIVTNASH